MHASQRVGDETGKFRYLSPPCSYSKILQAPQAETNALWSVLQSAVGEPQWWLLQSHALFLEAQELEFCVYSMHRQPWTSGTVLLNTRLSPSFPRRRSFLHRCSLTEQMSVCPLLYTFRKELAMSTCLRTDDCQVSASGTPLCTPTSSPSGLGQYWLGMGSKMHILTCLWSIVFLPGLFLMLLGEGCFPVLVILWII